MDKKELICCIDMFSAAQTFVTLEGEKVRVDMDCMNEFIPQYCFSHNLDTVHFYGADCFIRGIIDKKLNYGLENIKIEVN